MKQVIGFGDEYYTLWECSEGGRPVYVKNISKDLEVAKRQYPNAEVDLELHGERWVSWEPIKIEHYDDRFNFGKYKGILFKDCDDIDYMVWYAEQISNETQEWENLADILRTRGCVIDNSIIYTQKEWQEKLEYDRCKAEFEESIKLGLPFEYEFFSNQTKFRFFDMNFSFKEVKEMGNDYYGLYYLPVDSKGKAKRIKGKTVRMTKYEMVDNEVIIEEFEIL